MAIFSRVLSTLAASLVLLLLLFSQAEASLPQRNSTFIFNGTANADTLFTLPITWLEIDSVKVVRNGDSLREFSDWRIVDPGNKLWLIKPLNVSDTLVVSFLYRPIPLFKSYFRHTLRELNRKTSLTDTSRIVPAAEPQYASQLSDGWTKLNKSGSLIRSIQIGSSQDLALESALNLQIDGRVGKNVDVIAVLSDQSTPIQPEGTTESLSELDKVFVSVRSPHLSTTIGDYNIDLTGGQYDVFSRKLSGLIGQANYPIISATAAGAVSKGEFFTNSFFGQEANQGPYPLHGKDGRIGIVILAGTEKIWLNGTQLRRGEGNDYVIDYSSGEISFTSRRLITSDSRIVVDFEYSNENYEQLFGAARTESNFSSDKILGTFTYLTVSDDKSRPVNNTLSETEKQKLALSGDNADSAVVYTADSLGLNLGDYIRIDTLFQDSVYSMFIYSPRDSLNNPTGVWKVIFDDFNQGFGDYEAAADERGLTYFRWVGNSLGRYRPFRKLTLPKSQVLADARVQANLAKGLTLGGEIALSNLDRNTYSKLNDNDNSGVALTSKLNYNQEKTRIFGLNLHRIEFSGQIRNRDKKFQEISRASEIEFNRDWDTQNSQTSQETITETSLRVNPISPLALYTGYGNLNRQHIFSSDRLTAGASYSIRDIFRASISHLSLQSDDSTLNGRGKWIRQSALANGRVGKFSPRFLIEKEDKRNKSRIGDDGFRFWDYTTGLGLSLPHSISLDSEYRRRLDDKLQSSENFEKLSRAYTVSSEASYKPESIGSFLTRFSHREKNYLILDSSDVTSDVGRFEALIAPRQRLIEANLIYEVAKTQSQNQIFVAVQVTPGTGNYRREGNEYIPDDQGDYILVPRNTGNYEPATELSLNTLFWLRPDELPKRNASTLLRYLSTETEITLKEKTKKSLTASLLLLDQSEYRGGSTLNGNLNFRQDIHFSRLSSKFAVRLRYKSANSLDNQFLNGGQERNSKEGGLRVRARYSKSIRGETESVISNENYIYRSISVPSRDIFRYVLSQETTAQLSDKWETGLGLKISELNDERSQTQASLLEFRPRGSYTLTGKGKVDGSIGWIHASSNRAIIPFEIARGANRGENYSWNLRGTYQFSQNFSGSLNYDGRTDSGEKTFHTGRLEARATF